MDIYEFADNLNDKYGFKDGKDIPSNVGEVRATLMEYINCDLPKDSCIEVVAIDRPGLHNWCLLMYKHKVTGIYYRCVPDDVGVVLDRIHEEGSFSATLTVNLDID